MRQVTWGNDAPLGAVGGGWGGGSPALPAGWLAACWHGKGSSRGRRRRVGRTYLRGTLCGVGGRGGRCTVHRTVAPHAVRPSVRPSVERASEQGRLRTARRFGRGAVRTCVARTLWAAEQGQAGNPDVDDCADVVLLLPDQARPGDAPQRKRKRVTQGSIQIIERARTEYM